MEYDMDTVSFQEFSTDADNLALEVPEQTVVEKSIEMVTEAEALVEATKKSLQKRHLLTMDGFKHNEPHAFFSDDEGQINQIGQEGLRLSFL